MSSRSSGVLLFEFIKISTIPARTSISRKTINVLTMVAETFDSLHRSVVAIVRRAKERINILLVIINTFRANLFASVPAKRNAIFFRLENKIYNLKMSDAGRSGRHTARNYSLKFIGERILSVMTKSAETLYNMKCYFTVAMHLAGLRKWHPHGRAMGFSRAGVERD